MLLFYKYIFGYLSDADYTDFNIVFNIRLPRIVMVVVVGAALSLSGAIFQAIFRNPLVSPDLLGVSSGAGFGAILGFLIKSGGMVTVQGLSFIFGMLAVTTAYIISKTGSFNRILMLILSGVIVSSFFHSLIAIMKYVADPYNELPSMIFWSMGGFFRVSWSEVVFVVPPISIGILLIYF